mmetsp:Transcript_41309/g.119534  ORF Transcript_41309/g.119534 Transcript_41309/m.119534 type:complete len:489 (-) Transcript_41309:362-1828(-)
MTANVAGAAEATEATPLAGHKRPRPKCGAALRVRLVSSITSFAEGFDIGVINGAVILFREDLKLTDWEVGVVLAIFAVGVAVCAPVAGTVSDILGRKPTLMLSNILLVTGGLAMATATSFESMSFGRIVAGSGVGFGITVVTTYMSEIAPERDRGFYGSLEELFVNIGMVCAYVVNFFLLGVPEDWRYMMGAGAIPAAFAFIMLLLPASLSGIPESPRFLQKAGRTEEAKAVLAELVDDEKEVDRAVKNWALQEDLGFASWGEALKAFCGSHSRSAVAGIGVGVLSVWTGVVMLNVMTTSLLVDTGMRKDVAMKVTMLLGVVKISVMLVVALVILDRWGRRPLLLLSLCLCIVASAIGAGGSLLQGAVAWQVVGFCVFVIGFSVGVGPVPWVYMPEVLENHIRGKGCALGLSAARTCVTIQLLVLPVVLPLIGLGGVFAVLLLLNITGLIFVLCFCPETKGKSLEDMSTIFEATSRAPSMCCWAMRRA